MSAFAFDTLAQAENLQKYGFAENQAKGLVEVIVLASGNLAIKQDIDQIKLDMERIKLETRLEIKQECDKVRNELIEFKEETRHEFVLLDKKILRMTINFSGVLVVTLGVYTSVLQWLFI